MGKYHILKEYANGVMDEKGRFFPFRSCSSETTPPAAQANVRYFLKCALITKGKSGASAAADI